MLTESGKGEDIFTIDGSGTVSEIRNGGGTLVPQIGELQAFAARNEASIPNG